MKKILALCFAMFLTLTCFTACNMLDGVFSKKSGVNKKYYENCAVFTFDGFESKISITLDRTIPGEGAIYYQINIKKGALSVGYTDTGIGRKQQPLGEFTADEKMPINGSGGYIEGDKITITFKAISPVNGEIIIAFTEDALKVVHGNLQIHKHTYSYTSAGKVGHYTSFTCGCPSEEGTTPHYDENGDYICDACGYVMPEIPTPTNHFLRNQAGCEWLNEITAEDIAEIKIISEAVGVAPGNLNNVSSSTDEAVIARIFEEYYWLDTAPISKMEGQIDGGSGVTVKFILKDGTTKGLYINNGNYLDTNGDYFELLFTPNFEESDNATKAYGFITYIGTGTVYDKDNNPVCEIPMDEFEFVVFSGLDAVITGYYYRVETEFGTLWFDSSNDVFYLRFNEVEVDYREYREYYQLIGKNLDELIAEYSAISTD